MEVAADVTTPLHRYNACLPSVYRHALPAEQATQLLAIRTLAAAILREDPSGSAGFPCPPEEPATAEGYERPIERDLGAFEKGLTRYLDLKYALSSTDYPVVVNALLRGAVTHAVDMGLRSKLARAAVRVIRKRSCVLPDGIAWRPVLNTVLKFHLRCVDGGPFIGKDVRDAHCRNMLALLRKCRNFVQPQDDADQIWAEFGTQIDVAAPDRAFEPLLILAHVIPTRRDASLRWLPEALRLFESMSNCSDWDAVWLSILGRVAKHQPCQFDFSRHLPYIYSRIVPSFRLPLGSAAPQSPVDRRCPQHIAFMLSDNTTIAATLFSVYSLSPKFPSALQHLERLLTLLANFFHPSNGGRWTSTLGTFLQSLASVLTIRVTAERAATKAGHFERVFGTVHDPAVAPAEHRLPDEMVNSLVTQLLPLVEQGLHSKSSGMTIQAASASRDLATIAPHIVVEPLLMSASECLGSVSSPHRTSAALKMLAALTPVFLDPSLYPGGNSALPQALTLTLPGIDANDPSKTEATLRFIAGAAARIQSIMASDDPASAELAHFLDEYTHQLLERVFPLLDSLEAPARKNRNGAVPSGSAQPLSIFIFAVAMDNLFAAVPRNVAISSAERVARHVSGSASLNALKFYGALVRSVAGAAAVASETGSSCGIFIPRLLDQILVFPPGSCDSSSTRPELATLSEDELVWRFRMLAQACRRCGTGLEAYSGRVATAVSLSFTRSERRVYKAGGRLLRGILEGLTIVRTRIGAATGLESKAGGMTGCDEDFDNPTYDVEWISPKESDWALAESLVLRYLGEAETLARGPGEEGGDDPIVQGIRMNRDYLFRALRMLHAVQRGGRWIMAGVAPKQFQSLDCYSAAPAGAEVTMSKSDALLALRRPVAAGLGGERQDSKAPLVAVELWARAYTLTSAIITAVVAGRPDDGALLYRCLEPLELAHEPFRRSNQGRVTAHACRGYKAAYRPVVAAKRNFSAIGGVGRAMPKFIFKLRIEAHHELRLSLASRAGIESSELFEDIVEKVVDLSINAFPRVRAEARVVLARAWRVANPTTRRMEIERVINALGVVTSAATKLEDTPSSSTSALGLGPTPGEHGESEWEKSLKAQIESSTVENRKDALYEIMIGTAGILKSPAAAPLIMRDWSLFDRVARVLLPAIVVAERPDAGMAIGNLFSKLAGLARPLSIAPFRLVASDLGKEQPVVDSAEYQAQCAAGNQRLVDLNTHLLQLMAPKAGLGIHGETHWRLQSLVATVLAICLRSDQEPSAAVATFFAKSMVSDVVSLRKIAVKSVALILAMHGSDGKHGQKKYIRSTGIALSTVKTVLESDGFVKSLIRVLALDRDDSLGRDGNSSYQSVSAISTMGLMGFSRYMDGDAGWLVLSGPMWPMSWVPRSRDRYSIAQVRFYESLSRVYGEEFFTLMSRHISELVEALENKKEKVIDGVHDDNIRIIVGEMVAGIARGLCSADLKPNSDTSDVLFSGLKSLLDGFTGPEGAVDGGSLIRLIMTADEGSVGQQLWLRIADWILADQPLVNSMDSGGTAHLQARRLRYVHACVADRPPHDGELAVLVVQAVVPALTGQVACGHELKTVREEVARLLSLLAKFKAPRAVEAYRSGVQEVAKRLSSSAIAKGGDENHQTEIGNITKEMRSLRSREGETLSRWVSVVYWNGEAGSFGAYLPELLSSIVASLDEESDQDRVSHARQALSLAAQAGMTTDVARQTIAMCMQVSESPRYRVRGALLPFLQVLSLTVLFTADGATLSNIRRIVSRLLSDPQLEVREAAAATFVPLIRDAPETVIESLREEYVTYVKSSGSRSRSSRKTRNAAVQTKVADPTLARKRHGAVLALGSMIIAHPYDVPTWMPSVLVTLTACLNDPPPISSTTRRLFADFMRTHSDEWATHKQAFCQEDLELVSELMVSPSYYA